ncbi:MAG: cupin domain-containing protein [Dongiaceae bacterium]
MTKPLVTAAEIAAAPEVHIRHPFEPERSDVHLRPLGRMTGLQRLSVSLGRVPPGKEAFAYHAHERDEEFLYILSGRGRAVIDGRTCEVGPGDFMGFPTPSVPHLLTNPYDEDLVYLMAGEHSGFDLGHFPRHGRKILHTGREILCLDERAGTARPMSLAEFMPDGLPPGLAGGAGGEGESR